jgi:protein-L-isoaspartate O-methyltransferase
MSLVPVEIVESSDPLPSEVTAYLAEARERVQAFLDENRIPAFVACDFEPVYIALQSIRRTNLATGNVFCEWGSGFGVVASLAAGLGFESYGIEIEGPLVEHARELAADTNHRVSFVQGSFVTEGAEHIVDKTISSDVFWLNTDVDDAYQELQLDPDDFDVIFAYPWPGEDDVITGLFDHCAAQGALLVTYSYLDGVGVYRKTH